MNKKLLNTEIDDTMADFLVKKIEEHKSELESIYKKKAEKVNESFKAKMGTLFEHVDVIVAEKEKELKEEFSATLAAKIQEKNAKIEDLEEAVETFKEQMTERVNDFLTNSRDEIKSVVEEEMRLDADELKAQGVIESIRDLVGAKTKPVVESADEVKVARYEEDIKTLKERVDEQRSTIKTLRTQKHVKSLLESVPEADRDFFATQLQEVSGIKEADEKFNTLKKAVRESKVQLLEEQLEGSESRGSSEIEEDTDKAVLESNNKPADALDRIKYLAGIK
jgi:hypothetical protein